MTRRSEEVYRMYQTYFVVYADGCVVVGLQPPRIFARKLNIGMVDVLCETL